jgi:hypothetical protein
MSGGPCEGSGDVERNQGGSEGVQKWAVFRLEPCEDELGNESGAQVAE